MTMSEVVKLPLIQFASERRGFQPRNIRFLKPEAAPNPVDPKASSYANGRQSAENIFAIERKRLQDLVSAANALRHEDNAELGFILDNVIQSILAKIIGSLPTDASFLSQQIDAAVALLTDADHGRKLRMHPDDIALLSGTDLPLPCKADPELPRGALRIECSDGWIEHGPSFALESLNQALNNVENSK